MELRRSISLLFVAPLMFISMAVACSNGTCKMGDDCETNDDCETGLYCFSCPEANSSSKCVRSTATPVFNILNDSLPFNKYSFLTTHNSFAIADGIRRLTLYNQEDSVTQQLNNGVRALMLDTYDFEETVWLCHSIRGTCHDFTKFVPAIDILKEVYVFLLANPSEIVTIILEDYVQAPNGLTNVFTNAGLKSFWFPVESMPKEGQDWPLVRDMVANNQRLLVFGSVESKEQSEGIAYQWNYMVENQYGDGGMNPGECPNRKESSPMNDKTKSLVLVNYFRTLPIKELACHINNGAVGGLLNITETCYTDSGNRWANFLAVDYYKRSERGGAFQAVDFLNGERLCGYRDVHSCVPGGGGCTP